MLALQAESLRRPVACVDLETTGGLAAQHRVIEVGLDVRAGHALLNDRLAPECRAILVVNFPNTCLWVVSLEVGAEFEGDSKEFGGCPENAVVKHAL